MDQYQYNPYQAPLLLQMSPPLTKHNLRWLLISLLIVFTLEVVLVGAGLAVVYTEKPPANLDVPSGEKAYMMLWGSQTTSLPDHFTVQDTVAKMRSYAIYFLWDTYPKLEEVAESENLALKWPPLRGTRYRLAAYPFVQASNDFLPISILKAAFKMTNKYADQATPPAWYISVYDEKDWTRENIFMPDSVFQLAPGTKDSSTTHMTRRCSDIFGPYKWVEVVRTCYPVTKDSYPLCDDGGQWYYHAPGSGTWYNVGNCVVRYNKIDAAVYCMALVGVSSQRSSALPLDKIFDGLDGYPPVLLQGPPDKDAYANVYATIMNTPGCTLADYAGKTQWSEFWAVAKAHFVKRLKNNLGEKSFVKSLSKLIKDAKAKDAKSLNLEGFLPFQAFYSKDGAPLKGYLAFLASIAGVLGLSLAFLITLPASLFGQCSFLLPMFILALVCGGGFAWWEYGLDAFISSQGGNMISRGLDLYSVSPEDVIDFCVEPTIGAQDPEKQQFFSGLPSSWIADMSIEIFSSMLGFDVVIMHSQPNKSGTYLVEMCDVTKIKLDFGLSTQPVWWKGGTCGDEDVSDDFSCENCPFKEARGNGQPLFSRGGLCFKNLQIKGFENNYMTMNWTRVGDGGRWEGPAADSTIFTSFPQDGNFIDQDKRNMQDWLNNYNATVCDCRESKDAMCVGCEGKISDVLCNWSQRASLSSSPSFRSPGIPSSQKIPYSARSMKRV
jgi:hypothetical protein